MQFLNNIFDTTHFLAHCSVERNDPIRISYRRPTPINTICWKRDVPRRPTYHERMNNMCLIIGNLNMSEMWNLDPKIIIIKSNYNRANDVAVWQPTPKTADVTITKIAGYVRVRILMNLWFCPYFWHSHFLRYGHFVEYAYMSTWQKSNDGDFPYRQRTSAHLEWTSCVHRTQSI